MYAANDDEDDEIYFPEELCECYENKYTKLGAGSFSKVLLAEHKGTQELVAVKVMRKELLKKKNNLHRFQCEVEALKTLVHQNICQLYQVYESEEYVSLVMEHCPGGELFDYIVSKKRLPEHEARILFRQMISAFAFTHENGYAHRDIKPENMLLNNEKSIKVIDFGLSVKPASGLDVPLLTRVGSPAYAAPELVSGDLYFGNETDVWSLGVVLYAVLCGCLPFDEDTTQELYDSIKPAAVKRKGFLCSLRSPLGEPARSGGPARLMSTGSSQLIRSMLEVDPKKRITMASLRRHDWVTNGTEMPPVTSESTCQVSSSDTDIIEDVAEALNISEEDVKISIEEKKYDEAMAYCLMLSKRKEKDVRKFQLIYGLSNRDIEQLKLVGSENTSLTTRQRSSSERKGLIEKMMIDSDYDDSDDEMVQIKEKRSIFGKKGTMHESLPRRKISNIETSKMKPLLPIEERSKPDRSPNSRLKNLKDQIKGRSVTLNECKTRSGSKLNDLVSAVFRMEDKPRKCKGFYHMENTSTKSAELIRAELTRVLEEMTTHSLIYSYSNPKRSNFNVDSPHPPKSMQNTMMTCGNNIDSRDNRFVFRCKAFDKREKKMTFELEICSIPKVENVLGIRNKRLNGDVWCYKSLVEQIFAMAKL